MSGPRLALSVLGLLCACSSSGLGHYDRQQLEDRLASTQPPPGLVIGEFALASPAVIDGDTVKVQGIDGTLRLLGIDTEETFKSEDDRRAYDEGFDAYLAAKQAGHARPVKAATPLGMDAKHWAEDFFAGVRSVRLERDHPKELRGRYGRLLAYVMVQVEGRWLNYNVECVRAGMSPYFPKYGYSRRFHDQFVRAQDEARAARRGIWDPALEHYRDYDQRLRWWTARADVIEAFERQAEDREHWVALTNWDSMQRLEALEDQPVVLLGLVGDIRPREGKRPAQVMLSRRMFDDLPLVFFDDAVLARSDIEEARGEFVRVTGRLTRYEFRSRGGRRRASTPPPSQLQILVDRPEQIVFEDTRPARFATAPAPDPRPAAAPTPTDPAVEPDPPALEAPPRQADPVADPRPDAPSRQVEPASEPTPEPPTPEPPTPEPPTPERPTPERPTPERPAGSTPSGEPLAAEPVPSSTAPDPVSARHASPTPRARGRVVP